MDYQHLLDLKQRINNLKSNKSQDFDVMFQNYEKNFQIEYAHDSTTIEGNTLTLLETKLLLDDEISVGGKNLREIYEIINHNKAFEYVKSQTLSQIPLNEEIVKEIHNLLTTNILFQGGIYRDTQVYIKGAMHVPPSPEKMFNQIKCFYADLNEKNFSNPIEKAAWTHAEFVKIHPFVDGNGRCARMIMNYQLILSDFLPINIWSKNKLAYFSALDRYATTGDLNPFIDIIAGCEDFSLRDLLCCIDPAFAAEESYSTVKERSEYIEYEQRFAKSKTHQTVNL